MIWNFFYFFDLFDETILQPEVETFCVVQKDKMVNKFEDEYVVTSNGNENFKSSDLLYCRVSETLLSNFVSSLIKQSDDVIKKQQWDSNMRCIEIFFDT